MRSQIDFGKWGRWGVAFLLLMPVLVRAQDFLIPPALYPVKNAPFEVLVETRWEGASGAGEGRNVSRIVRDSAGRQRFEMPSLEEAAVTGVVARVTIYDVVGERIIQLDTVRRTATVTSMTRVGRGLSLDVGARRGFPCKAAPGGESLGVKFVAGFETCGQRLPGRTLWLSTNYLMPLMAVKDDRRLGQVTEQALEVRPGEPDAALFEVPTGYVVTGK
jgi:hypothetical protein